MKKYKFSSLDVAKVGDLYTYEVVASSQQEAFRKLVEWFYAEGSPHNSDIVQEHSSVNYPFDTFCKGLDGMPTWFAQCISGGNGDRPCWHKFEKYVNKHGIKLKKDV